MSVELRMTDEQATWLRKHLDNLLDDAHWQRGVLHKDEDSREHAQTLHDKIKTAQDEKSWDRGSR